MSILTAENLGLSFGAFDLFRGISLSVANDSKIALIGPNGIGKTSLLLILAGINPPTEGQVHLARGRRLGYLRQEAIDTFADRSHTVYAEMQSVFAGLLEQGERLHQLEAEMAGDAASSTALLEEYGRLQEAFAAAGGYDLDTRIQQTLEGLGLGRKYWGSPLSHLSGGQKTRLLLARLLLEKPDLLMLDEPTNHLDIEAVEWLEHTLGEWEGAVLIVSHDRYFLDHTVNTIWEMNHAGLETYSGGYSDYLLQRQQRWEYAERVYQEEKARLLNEVDFIQRNWVRASSHARALGLLRRLSREISIVQNFGILALRSGRQWSEYGLASDRPLDVIEAVRAVNAIAPPNRRPPRIKPRLAADTTSGTIVLRAEQVTVGYPGHALFSVRGLELRRGECAALIGPNGSGKTSFLRTMLGQIEPLAGEVQLGASLKIGYFAQAQDTLDPSHTVIEELVAHQEMEAYAAPLKRDAGAARSYLAQYLFQEEEVFKPVGALSGGEKARLALAILALDGANFLVLDEPTNHLDIPAQEALQEVLEDFSGTILLVSHDRYLIDRLATQVWELRHGGLHVFRGSYREFVLRHSPAPAGRRTTAAATKKTAAPRALPPARPLLRLDSREARKKAEALAQVEGRIQQAENEVQRLSSSLAQAGEKHAFEKVRQLSDQLARAQAALEQYMAEWEKLAG
jgi:ATP-binding cassette subfamily F protein 3